MTARELIAQLETCDLDKEVAIIMSVTFEDQDDVVRIIFKEIRDVIEEEKIIGLQ